jgi:transcriptional regulator of acetoin/glycerol metabolism
LSAITAVSTRAMRRIWEDFTQGHDAGLETINPLIRESWLRARQYGLNALTKEAPMVLSPECLKAALAENRLYRAASSSVRLISDALAGRNILVLLLDEKGVLIDIVGDSATLHHAAMLGIVPGCQMDEHTIGTDAISCSLALGTPTKVEFFEHYIQIGHQWAGSAAPLRQPFTNELMGCLSVYGHGDAGHPAALEFVKNAARMVEHEFETQETKARFALLQNYEFHRAKYPNDELLCISRDGIAFAGSPVALNLMGFSHATPNDIGGFLHVLDIPETGFGRFREATEVQLKTKGGASLKAELRPIVSECELVGFVGVLPAKAPARRRNISTEWRAQYTFADIICADGKLAECISGAQRVALESWPVLITGESGTGKELFAHSVHNASPRRTGPFVAVNCGGLNDELMGAEIFGYSDGAFTGAIRGGKAGKLELANGGTLFLDEAEAMSPKMQVHLLRVLEEGRVTPVGAQRPKPIDVRVIAATNVDLLEKIKEGSFRRDLYYRLSELSIAVPPLRERIADIPLLANHFLEELGHVEIQSDALARLTSYCWPGNVRQLRNLLRQAATAAKGPTITAADLPAAVCLSACRTSDCAYPAHESDAPALAVSSLREAERDAILRALRDCDGNISRTSARLGIHRVTLHRKLEALGIKVGRTFD